MEVGSFSTHSGSLKFINLKPILWNMKITPCINFIRKDKVNFLKRFMVEAKLQALHSYCLRSLWVWWIAPIANAPAHRPHGRPVKLAIPLVCVRENWFWSVSVRIGSYIWTLQVSIYLQLSVGTWTNWWRPVDFWGIFSRSRITEKSGWPDLWTYNL